MKMPEVLGMKKTKAFKTNLQKHHTALLAEIIICRPYDFRFCAWPHVLPINTEFSGSFFQ